MTELDAFMLGYYGALDRGLAISNPFRSATQVDLYRRFEDGVEVVFHENKQLDNIRDSID